MSMEIHLVKKENQKKKRKKNTKNEQKNRCFKLTERDIKKLKNKDEQLNDSIIKYFMNNIEHNINAGQYEKKIFCADPMFWLKLRDYISKHKMQTLFNGDENKKPPFPVLHLSLSRIKKKFEKYGAYDRQIDSTKCISTIFIPINTGIMTSAKHWFLGVIDIKNKTMKTYNSLRGDGRTAQQFFKLMTYILLKHPDWKTSIQWSTDIDQEFPQQNRYSNNCGLYVLKAARHIAYKKKEEFKDDSIKNGQFRSSLLKQI